MEIRQLRTFSVVAAHLSFTKAAAKLHLAQSTVSAQIRALEEELDTTLFDRVGRRILLTEAGSKLFRYAVRVLEMTREIKNEVAEGHMLEGSLNIRTPQSVAEVFMPEVIRAFHAGNPGVRLNFLNCTENELREELNSGRVDLAFVMTDSLRVKEVDVHMLRSLDLVLVSGATHPLAGESAFPLSALENETILMARTD